MGSTRASSRLVFYLVALSFVAQIALTQQDEYEYYYEEVSATSATNDTTTTTPTSVTTGTTAENVTQATDSVTQATESVTTETSTATFLETTNINPVPISPMPINDDADEEPTIVYPVLSNVSVTAVSGGKPLSTKYDHRTNLSLLNTTRPGTRTTKRPSTQPGIVLNIYTGMYGMHSQANNRPTGNRGNQGWNKLWPRAQSPLQGWYNLYGAPNRRPVQSFVPQPQRRPIYRGRGPVYEYDDGSYYPVAANQRPTKPRRNSQPAGRPASSTLDQQASMAVYNFLLQILGQRGTGGRSQPPTKSAGSRRRV
uniref:Uncharacterized protein n=1 Tax=Anopheles coluzzii TaxID=1518534 RepID=A0A6E8VBH1_ANOCL|nr:uncharacterized protein LOC120952646 [Anopheles coluzzii]